MTEYRLNVDVVVEAKTAKEAKQLVARVLRILKPTTTTIHTCEENKDD